MEHSSSDASFLLFVSIYGEIEELKSIDLKDLMTDVGRFGRPFLALKADITPYVDIKMHLKQTRLCR